MYLAELKLIEAALVRINEFSNPEYYDVEKGEFTPACPEQVEAVYLSSSGITSLKNCPRVVNATFNLSDTKLTSAAGGPDKVGVYCSGPITSLEGLPSIITEELDLTDSAISSLESIHRHVKQLGTDAANTGILRVRGQNLKSGGLGLLLIDGFFRIIHRSNVRLDISPFGHAAKIINEYTEHNTGRKGLVECQERLLDAGLDEFAEI